MSDDDNIVEIQRSLHVVPDDPTEAWDVGFANGLAMRDAMKRERDEARQQAKRLEEQLRAMTRTALLHGWSSQRIVSAINAALAADPRPDEAGGEGNHAQILTAEGWVDPNWLSDERRRG